MSVLDKINVEDIAGRILEVEKKEMAREISLVEEAEFFEEFGKDVMEGAEALDLLIHLAQMDDLTGFCTAADEIKDRDWDVISLISIFALAAD